jgi:hypothetical protein
MVPESLYPASSHHKLRAGGERAGGAAPVVIVFVCSMNNTLLSDRAIINEKFDFHLRTLWNL